MSVILPAVIAGWLAAAVFQSGLAGIVTGVIVGGLALYYEDKPKDAKDYYHWTK